MLPHLICQSRWEFCRAFPHQEEVTVKGIHFVQEDSPAEIGAAIARFLERIS